MIEKERDIGNMKGKEKKEIGEIEIEMIEKEKEKVKDIENMKEIEAIEIEKEDILIMNKINGNKERKENNFY